MNSLLIIQGCPVFSDIGPYWAIVVNDARAQVDALYRGTDADSILHAHGKHDQNELIAMGFPADPYLESSHTEHSDGRVYPQVPRGGSLRAHGIWWGCGLDINTRPDPRVIARMYAAAAKYGWEIFQPYSSEPWHFNFKVRPKRPTPGTVLWARLWRLRATLPRS